MSEKKVPKNPIIKIINIVGFNLLNILLFECIYNLIVTSLIWPGVRWLFALAQNVARVPYLTQFTIKNLFMNPIADIIFVLILFILAYFCVFEINVIIINYTDRSIKKSIYELTKESLKKSLYVFKPKNWLVLLFVLLLLPLDNGLYITSISKIIVLPSFILEGFENNMMAQMIILTVQIILATGLAFCVFSFFYMVDDNTQSFIQAIKKSIKLIRRHFWHTVLATFGMLIVISLVLAGLKYGSLYLLAYSIKALAPEALGYEVYAFVFAIVNSIGVFLSFCIQFICPLAIICYLKEKFSNGADEKLGLNDEEAEHIHKAGHPVLTFIMILVICLFYGVAGFTEYVLRQDIEIVAHRAGGAYRPENSLSALAYSIEMGADRAEMDVQQTKDGVLIISHDSNFRRLSKVDKNAWEVTYDEVLTFDNGSYFSSEYADEKYPTLEQVLQMAKGHIKLIIELKATGHENNLEQETVDLINKYDMKDDVYIASMNQECLDKVKAYDSTMNTQLITSVVMGNVQNMDTVDCLSIEKTFANSNLSFNMHSANKQLFVWTVNNAAGMQEVINSDADGLITDDFITAQSIKNSATGDDIADAIGKQVFGLNKE